MQPVLLQSQLNPSIYVTFEVFQNVTYCLNPISLCSSA